MHLSPVQWSLVLATLALQAGIIGLMVRRRSRSAFPFFFNYILFSFITLVAWAPAAQYLSPQAYFYVFWSIMGTQALLCFGVIYEVFIYILKPYSALVDLGRLLFKWAIAFLALVSVITAVATNGSGASRICAATQLLGRSSELMQCGLLLLFVLFEARLGVSWRSPAACVILGFGSNAAFALATPLLGRFFPNSYAALDVAGTIVGVMVYALWCASFALPQPSRRTVQDSPSRLILQRWNEALLASPLVSRRGEVIAMSPVESFLPGVERTVERVMARKMTQ
jgi:hypothetical protein